MFFLSSGLFFSISYQSEILNFFCKNSTDVGITQQYDLKFFIPFFYLYSPDILLLDQNIIFRASELIHILIYLHIESRLVFLSGKCVLLF